MLTEKRHEYILQELKRKGSITVNEIKEELGISESTIRRDLNSLDEEGRLVKVFGGAVSADFEVSGSEPSVMQKREININGKKLIAKYAAGLIEPDDFVYMDAGTTTGCMIDYITEKRAVYVTNAVTHARNLAALGFRVILIGGELKGSTE
jgi:DeoR family fructose operon transcriptional repressor